MKNAIIIGVATALILSGLYFFKDQIVAIVQAGQEVPNLKKIVGEQVEINRALEGYTKDNDREWERQKEKEDREWERQKELDNNQWQMIQSIVEGN